MTLSFHIFTNYLLSTLVLSAHDHSPQSLTLHIHSSLTMLTLCMTTFTYNIHSLCQLHSFHSPDPAFIRYNPMYTPVYSVSAFFLFKPDLDKLTWLRLEVWTSKSWMKHLFLIWCLYNPLSHRDLWGCTLHSLHSLTRSLTHSMHSLTHWLTYYTDLLITLTYSLHSLTYYTHLLITLTCSLHSLITLTCSLHSLTHYIHSLTKTSYNSHSTLTGNLRNTNTLRIGFVTYYGNLLLQMECMSSLHHHTVIWFTLFLLITIDPPSTRIRNDSNP